MASPVGHVLISLGLATAAVRATGIAASPALWLGTAITSCVPDLDLVAVMFGLSVRRVHRQATHSLVVLSGLILAGAWAWGRLPVSADPSLGLTWSVALLSHPVLDVLTTGPRTAAQGFGIPLLWPLLRHRWFLQHPILDTGGLMVCRSFQEIWNAILPELHLLGPVLIGIVVLGCLV